MKAIHWVIIAASSVVLIGGGIGLVMWNNKKNKSEGTGDDTDTEEDGTDTGGDDDGLDTQDHTAPPPDEVTPPARTLTQAQADQLAQAIKRAMSQPSTVGTRAMIASYKNTLTTHGYRYNLDGTATYIASFGFCGFSKQKSFYEQPLP
ncbi:MAG: hypothetical protein WCT77_00230 [Bacteroidota bacterium]